MSLFASQIPLSDDNETLEQAMQHIPGRAIEAAMRMALINGRRYGERGLIVSMVDHKGTLHTNWNPGTFGDDILNTLEIPADGKIRSVLAIYEVAEDAVLLFLSYNAETNLGEARALLIELPADDSPEYEQVVSRTSSDGESLPIVAPDGRMMWV
jgi:hypothetical protein